MAGIGFRLQKLLSEGTYTSTLKAYFFSSLLVSGPMLMTVVAIAVLSAVTFNQLTVFDQDYLKTVILYGYALSLLTVGPGYLVLTRSIADDYYQNHSEGFTATYFSATGLYLLLFGPLGLWYFWNLSYSGLIPILATILFLIIAAIWIAMIFLSAAQNYSSLIWAFFWGNLVSCLFAWKLGDWNGMTGYLSGFMIGQGLLLVLLVRSIVREFGYSEALNYDWLIYFKRHPLLIGIGLFYNLGIWIDKFVFWNSIEGVILDARLVNSPIYDGPMFMAFLSAIPALSYFLIQMETDFFTHYQAYYQSAQTRQTFAVMEQRRQRMLESLNQGLSRLLVFQSIASGITLLAAPAIASLLRMDPLQLGVFRTGILACFFQVGFLVVMNITLYFDFKKDAFFSAFVLCAGNWLFTDLSLRFGLPAYGFGFLFSNFLAFVVGLGLLSWRVRKIHYWTFMSQPISKPIFVYEQDN